MSYPGMDAEYVDLIIEMWRDVRQDHTVQAWHYESPNHFTCTCGFDGPSPEEHRAVELVYALVH